MHFVAFWFFIYAFQTLSYLHDTKLIDTVRQLNGQLTSTTLARNKIQASDLSDFLVFTSVSGLAGLLVAFIISLIISIKRHWFWINSLTAFLLIYILYRFDILGWTYLKRIFWYAGQQFDHSVIEFLLNGTILLVIGILIFFLRRSNHFIENKK